MAGLDRGGVGQGVAMDLLLGMHFDVSVIEGKTGSWNTLPAPK